MLMSPWECHQKVLPCGNSNSAIVLWRFLCYTNSSRNVKWVVQILNVMCLLCISIRVGIICHKKSFRGTRSAVQHSRGSRELVSCTQKKSRTYSVGLPTQWLQWEVRYKILIPLCAKSAKIKPCLNFIHWNRWTVTKVETYTHQNAPLAKMCKCNKILPVSEKDKEKLSQ